MRSRGQLFLPCRIFLYARPFNKDKNGAENTGRRTAYEIYRELKKK